jgi:hypothetical protein
MKLTGRETIPDEAIKFTQNSRSTTCEHVTFKLKEAKCVVYTNK